MQLGEIIGEPPRLFHHIFDEFLPSKALDNIVNKKQVPLISQTRNARDLRRAVDHYIKSLYGARESEYCETFARLIVESNSQRDLHKFLDEPTQESDLKPVLSHELRRMKNFKVHSREVPIGGSTRADLVAYKRRHEVWEEKGFLGRIKDRKRIPWFEFLGVELKTAKRSPDPLYRQVRVYTERFDNSFLVITPLTVLAWGGKEYHNVTRFVQEMREKGMGVLLVNKHRILGTVIRSQERVIGEKTRRELTQKLGLS
jgi:hypothetical protein